MLTEVFFHNFPVSIIREECERIIGVNVSPLVPQKVQADDFPYRGTFLPLYVPGEHVGGPRDVRCPDRGGGVRYV